ncbi:MAG TPA: GNAT family N-acetyltransferase [Gallionella sp.]|nr:GNAT family N-acetyltransferase [Gallionella sp.]
MSTNTHGFEIHADKNIEPAELANLMASVGWGDETDYRPEVLLRSMAAYPLVAHCRDASGQLVGYVTAFTDGAFSTFIGELVVRPQFQRQGIGSALLEVIVEKCRGIPIYGTPFEDTREFFLARGFQEPKRAMSVVSMRNAA